MHSPGFWGLLHLEFYKQMNETLTIIVLQEQLNQVTSFLEPLRSQVNSLQQKLSCLDGFITNHPKVDLIQETVQFLNSSLKIEERLNLIEGKQVEVITYYDEMLRKHQMQISQMQPCIAEMNNLIEEFRSNREVNQQLRQNFLDMNQKYKQNMATLLQNDRLTHQLKTSIEQLEGKLASKIDHHEITTVQDMLRRDFVTCIQLDELRHNVKEKLERITKESATKQMFSAMQSDFDSIVRLQSEQLKELVDSKLEELALSKLKSYASRYDLKLFEDRINQYCKILSEKLTILSNEMNQKMQRFLEQMSDSLQVQLDFKTQISLINQSLQKVVLKDEMQQYVQKTLRLQRESEFLNEKFEQLNTELFEQKVTFQALNKQRTIELQQLQMQFTYAQPEFSKINSGIDSQAKLTNVSGKEIKRDGSIQIVDLPSDQNFKGEEMPDNNNISPQLSLNGSITKFKRAVSSIKQKAQGSSQDELLKRLLTKQEDRFLALEQQIDELKMKGPSRSKFYQEQHENQSYQPVVAENKRFQFMEERLEDIIRTMTVIRAEMIQFEENKNTLVDMIKQQAIKFQQLKDMELKIDQKCDQSLIIPIIDLKASAAELLSVATLCRGLKQCLVETVQSLRTYFTSDQNDQIRELLVHSLKRSLMVFSQQEDRSAQQPITTCKTESAQNHLVPKYNNSSRYKSYSSYSQKRRPLEIESRTQIVRGKSMNKDLKAEISQFQSLKNSPLAYKTVNISKKSVQIIKSLRN